MLVKSKPEPITLSVPTDKVNIIYEVAKSRLVSQDTLDIDFSRIANLSSFQRFFIEAIKQVFPNIFKSVDPRASKQKTAEQFNKQKLFMKDCVSEFEDLLVKRKNK